MKLDVQKIIENLILGLVFVLPFNFAYILNFHDVQGFLFFSENLKHSIFLFDVLFVFLLLFWLIRKFATKTFFLHWNALLILVYLISTSFFIASDSKTALYNSLRIFEVICFFCIFIDTVKTKKLFSKVVYLIFLSGVIQSLIAFFQFLFQKSLGLKFLGESILASNILGVAKIEVAGEKFIRGYGTFPHSNLLGAFLFLALSAGLYFVFTKDPRTPFDLSGKFPKIKLAESTRNLIRKTHFRGGLLIITVGIISTFSRSIWLITAYLGFLMALRYFKYLFQKKYIIKYLLPITIFLIVIFAGFYQFIPARICPGNCQDQSLTLRQTYSEFSKTIIRNNFIFGIGAGQFVGEFKTLNPYNFEDWNIQPVHNLYLIIWSELGFIGFLLIFTFIFKNISLKNLSFGNEFFLIVIGGFVVLAIFDHYFWTLPQGQFIFWLSLALLATSGRIEK